MATHGPHAFEHISAARRSMLHECQVYVDTEISRLQRDLELLPDRINESIRVLRMILQLLEEEWLYETGLPARARPHLQRHHDSHERFQHGDRNSGPYRRVQPYFFWRR